MGSARGAAGQAMHRKGRYLLVWGLAVGAVRWRGASGEEPAPSQVCAHPLKLHAPRKACGCCISCARVHNQSCKLVQSMKCMQRELEHMSEKH